MSEKFTTTRCDLAMKRADGFCSDASTYRRGAGVESACSNRVQAARLAPSGPTPQPAGRGSAARLAAPAASRLPRQRRIFLPALLSAILGDMKIAQPRHLWPAAGVAFAALVAAAVTGLAFSAWIEKGADIFMTYAEAGLAWCF